jgi:hypothetical protein
LLELAVEICGGRCLRVCRKRRTENARPAEKYVRQEQTRLAGFANGNH